MQKGIYRKLRKATFLAVVLFSLYGIYCFIAFLYYSIQYLSHSVYNEEQLLRDMERIKQCGINRNLRNQLQYNGHSHPCDMTGINKTSYEKALARHASKTDKSLLLVMIDKGSLDFTMNFYESSLKKQGVDNYLFVSVDKNACITLNERGISCYLYREDPDASHDSDYYSQDFLRKMNYRTFMILDALNFGYTILHSDVDMYFFKNPFDEINCKISMCDMMILNDHDIVYVTDNYNAGFLYINPTDASIEVYKHMAYMAFHMKWDDQYQLNYALKAVVKDSMLDRKEMHLKVHFLDKYLYTSGSVFWQQGNVHFRDQNVNPDAVVVHNNWIVGLIAKEYRFKEMLMWVYDKEGYYSSEKRKYIMYNNLIELDSELELQHAEMVALKNAFAIGEILNRTVILPYFHCTAKKTRCNLLSLLSVKQLQKQFPAFREHSFLSHPKLPETITQYHTKIIQIDTKSKFSQVTLETLKDKYINLYESEKHSGATSAEIKRWFGDEKASVLVFGTLYDSFYQFDDPEKEKVFREKVEKGFLSVDYKQMSPSALRWVDLPAAPLSS